MGAGIVGLATARALQQRTGDDVIVLDKEAAVAQHQSGNNSGVLHSGLYYRPGSLKARLCAAGRVAMVRYCEERALAHDVTGKIVVASTAGEEGSLVTLAERGRANGLAVRRLDAAELAEREPHVDAHASLLVPEAGRVDFAAVCGSLAAEIADAGGEVRLGIEVAAISPAARGVEVETSAGSLTAAAAVVCAGLRSCELAGGLAGGHRIVPFRGEYWHLRPDRRHLVRGLVYPVPDARFPFLGVHATRGLDGNVHFGPNAVLALAPEGYRWGDVDFRHIVALARGPGVRRLVHQHWRTGIDEAIRSLRPTRLLAAARRLVPALEPGDLSPGGAGVRAQAVAPDGSFVDDFLIVRDPAAPIAHVLNAPSPAATAAFAIADHLVDDVVDLVAPRPPGPGAG